ncbi:hypothetical protein [Vibrio metoecus]|uniref:hypothetical protein n=1 Tax=Vibrio metoecus TaxID=1481663 RepID=UPI000BA90094|nr:hypothetical protein [Vibrio metoecus]PAR45117.1 hypothetical protein CGT95_16955 [Vibrio metoecus]
MKKIFYKGGVSMVNRQDDPTHQCTSCYKPWFQDEIFTGLAVMQPQCPSCGAVIRKLTKDQPLFTK